MHTFFMWLPIKSRKYATHLTTCTEVTIVSPQWLAILWYPTYYFGVAITAALSFVPCQIVWNCWFAREMICLCLLRNQTSTQHSLSIVFEYVLNRLRLGTSN